MTQAAETRDTKPRIFGFVNGHWGDDVVVIAVSEDGYELASHVSSSEGFARSDISREWKHDAYNKHYPNGWEFVWIDDPKNDPRRPKPAPPVVRDHAMDPRD